MAVITIGSAASVGRKTLNSNFSALNASITKTDNRFSALNWAQIGTASLVGLATENTFSINLSRTAALFDELLIIISKVYCNSTYGGAVELTNISSLPFSTTDVVTYAGSKMPYSSWDSKGGAHSAIWIYQGWDRRKSAVTIWQYYATGATGTNIKNEISGFISNMISVGTTITGKVTINRTSAPIESGEIVVYGRGKP